MTIEIRKPETDVTPAQPRPAMGLVPRDISEAYRLAQAFAQSGMFAVKSPEAALVVLLTGMELGLGPAQALRSIFVVEGKPALSAQLMVGLCKSRRDVCEYFACVESTDTGATYETKRVGEPRAVRLSFTAEDAKRAGVLGKGNWAKFPAAMYRARASSLLARDVYPDLLANLYDPDELGGEARHVVDARPAAVVAAHAEVEAAEAHVDAAVDATDWVQAVRDDIESARVPPERVVPLDVAAVIWLDRKPEHADPSDVKAAWFALLGACPTGTKGAALQRACAAEAKRRATAVDAQPAASDATGTEG